MKRGLAGSIVLLVVCSLFVAASCGNDGPERTKIVPSHAGDRGESCQTSGDCKEALACVNNVCVKNEYDVETTSKTCRRIECSQDDDCCELSSQCQVLEQQCNEGNDLACEEFNTRNCDRCELKCEEGACVQDLSCDDDQDCGFDGNCSNGECVQCESDGDCPGETQCEDNRCVDICETDESCPLFHDCEDGDCVETGCQNDRECVLFTNDGNATCSDDGECLLPCTTDAECNQGSDGFFQICEEGKCKFVGCENDRECRIALGLANTDSAQATCE